MQIKNRKKTQKVARVLLNSKKSSTFAVKTTLYASG